jgi:hypothetical protein
MVTDFTIICHEGTEGELYSFFGLGARWRWVVNATPWPLYYLEKGTRYPLYRRLVGTQAGQDGCG